MKRYRMPFALAAAAMLGAFGPGLPPRPALAGVAPSAAMVQVNETLVSFPDVRPYIHKDGYLMVPVRPVAEAMGAEVTVDAEKPGHVTISRNGDSLDLLVGTDVAAANGLPERLETEAILVDGRVVAPLRPLLRWSRMRAEWIGEQSLAIVHKDGERHAPAVQMQPHRIVETADDYIGVPYVWGGAQPGGFDCSGFVQYVYRKHGVELPRTSREMFAEVGDFVPTAELQPGDLVFFAEGKGQGRRTSHVGIYIGDNRFISATNSYGVHVANLHGTYWGPQYIGAKRVL